MLASARPNHGKKAPQTIRTLRLAMQLMCLAPSISTTGQSGRTGRSGVTYIRFTGLRAPITISTGTSIRLSSSSVKAN